MTSRKSLIDNVKALKSLIDEEQGIPDQLVGAGIPILTGYGGGLVAAGGASYGFRGGDFYRKKKGSNTYVRYPSEYQQKSRKYNM